ncbi:hypothetical protein DPX16_22550 [Anabarilius grahami]|uniref:Uncharacterized protein n=1 Tax=Anabarilius grahami TaxID=495550 RepID=A0A3N0XGW3_ANAGA|nr:hypothetical protein DPX16_22550 [Anabarilius grahami]
MDAAKNIADELNRARYTENVLKYFFEKPDDYEQALTDSEDDLSDDESSIIRLNNIPNLQLSEDEDEEECIGLASDELDRKISEAISIITFDGDKDREMVKIRNFDCKCCTRRKENSLHGRQSCSQKLSPDIMYNIRLDSLAAEKEWQDMRIIGHLEANRRTVQTSEMVTSTKKTPTKRNFDAKRPGVVLAKTHCDAQPVEYQLLRDGADLPSIDGLSVLAPPGLNIDRQTYLIGKDTLADIVKHYEENGARPRLRKKHSLPRPPARFIRPEDINRVVDFIKNYAEDNAIMLPGRQPGHKDWHVKLLPTHVSKASVWHLYVKSAKELGERAVCKTSFKALWDRLLPHIKSCRPRTDLCWQYQSNNEQLIQSANLPDDRKSEAVKKQQDHLSLVQKERAVYNDMTAACRKICSGSNLSFGPSLPASKKIRMHYSFDFAQQVVENSSPVSHLNIPQLVGTAEGKVLVQAFDWQQHLTHHFRRLPQIKSYQHFSFDAKRPGVVLAKTHCDAQPVEYQLLRDGADLPSIDGLSVLAPPGLNIDRQTYLYEKIRPFCADEARYTTCPAPRVITQKRPRM